MTNKEHKFKSKKERKEYRKNLNKLSPAKEAKLTKRFWKKVEQDKFNNAKPSSKPTTTKLAEVTYEVLEAEELKEFGYNSKLPYAVTKLVDNKVSQLIKWFGDEDSAYNYLENKVSFL